MAKMNAAVVTSFSEPPHYQQFEVPQPRSPDEMLVDVLAVGLHPRTRTGAAGAHYTSTGALPMIPGIDGVGQRPDGQRIYFVADDEAIGTMAEKAAVDRRRAIPLSDDVDVAKVAATMNPAMSAWVALRRRVPIEPGQSVLVLGATGNAGTMAVQVAKRLGAGRVVGGGRNLIRLNALTSTRVYLAELPSLVDEINAGRIGVTPHTMPLADVENIWAEADRPGERTVLVP
jgi:NADPH:quinone reductase-like Zn-dependent oxidoreductase